MSRDERDAAIRALARMAKLGYPVGTATWVSAREVVRATGPDMPWLDDAERDNDWQ